MIVNSLAKIRSVEYYTCTRVFTRVHILYFACVLQTKLEGRLELKTNPILASVWRGDTILNNYSSLYAVFPRTMESHSPPSPPHSDRRICARTHVHTRAVGRKEGYSCECYSRDRASIYYRVRRSYVYPLRYFILYFIFAVLC